jgi:argininosuccinate lyase
MSAMITVDRLSEELQLWTTAEFGYFEPADRHSRTSVIMPQKKNPYGLAMIRGHARDQVGHLISVITTNLTLTGQPDNRVRAYGEVPASLERLEGAAGLLAEHLELGEFDTVAMAKSAGIDFTTATEICDWMSFEHGVSNRDAHAVVGKAVRHAIERGSDSLTLEDIQQAAGELEVELPSIEPGLLDSLQDPMTTLEHRTGLGSVTDVERMIQELARQLDTLPSSRFADFEQRYLDSIVRAIDERNAT